MPNNDQNGKRRTVAPETRGTAVGFMAIILWGLMMALVRVVSTSFGATLGPALIYTCGKVLLLIFHRPAPIGKYPKRYLLVGGLLFVFYESSIALSIGLATTDAQSVEVSLVNYLWPTLMVLLAAALAKPRVPGAVWRAIPGAAVATAGVVLAVGGNSGLDWHAAAGHIIANPLPYALTFAGAIAWSVYAVITPDLSEGFDGTSVFFPGVAVALWIIHFTSGDGWPTTMPPAHAWLMVVLTAATIAGGYACWGYGILHGSMHTLAVASYATPVLSVGSSAIILGVSLSLPFWCGALLVVFGSVLNLMAEKRKR